MPKALPHPDCFYLNAAVGWLELSNPAEALLELAHVSAASVFNPQVLETKWQSLARLERWEHSLPVARTFCVVAPGLPQGWLHQAVSLYRLSRTQEAWALLLPMADKFPNSWVIPYDLSCYACQLDLLDDARAWLRKAFSMGDPKEVKGLALADTDLERLWPEIHADLFEAKEPAQATA